MPRGNLLSGVGLLFFLAGVYLPASHHGPGLGGYLLYGIAFAVAGLALMQIGHRLGR